MPDFYAPGEYDLGGFAVGEVAPKRVLPRKDIRSGDVVLGLGSSGCHSNGYSLLRKLLSQELGTTRDEKARELLTPTRIYARSLAPLLKEGRIKGLAHITGSGFLNVPRMNEKVSYSIDLPAWDELPPIYQWIRERSALPLMELAQTFNLGIGMVVVVAPTEAAAVVKKLRARGEKVWKLGEVRKEKGPSRVVLTASGETVQLNYA